MKVSHVGLTFCLFIAAISTDADPRKPRQISGENVQSRSASTLTGLTPRLGSFDRLIMELFKPVPGDGGPGSSYLGLPYHDTWISAIVRNAAGQTYWLMQTDNVHGHDRSLAVKTVPDKHHMQKIPGLHSGTRLVDFSLGERKELKYSAVGPGVSPVELVITDIKFHWSEKGSVNLYGQLATPGIQLIIPWRRDGKAGIQLYTAQHYFARGTVLGEHVTGFLLFEHNYDHGHWDRSAFNNYCGALVTFTNEYDDGSVETGYFYCGALQAAILTNEHGEKIIDTTSVQVDAKISDDGALLEALYTLGDGSKWKFTRDPGASVNFTALFGLPPDSKGKMPPSALSFGRIVRVGEARKLVNWWTSSEAGTQSHKACSRRK